MGPYVGTDVDAPDFLAVVDVDPDSETYAGVVDHEAAYLLLCVATPTADCPVRVGAAVQDELVSNPWG